MTTIRKPFLSAVALAAEIRKRLEAGPCRECQAPDILPADRGLYLANWRVDLKPEDRPAGCEGKIREAAIEVMRVHELAER